MKRTLTLLLVAFAFMANVNAQKGIDGSTIDCSTKYIAGDTMDLSFTLDYASTDNLLAKELHLILPEGFQVIGLSSVYMYWGYDLWGGFRINKNQADADSIHWMGGTDGPPRHLQPCRGIRLPVCLRRVWHPYRRSHDLRMSGRVVKHRSHS